MKAIWKYRLAGVMTVLLLSALAACGSQPAPADQPIPAASPAAEGEPTATADVDADRPTVPADVAEGIAYLYDFRFSQRYDDRVSEEFSLKLPGGAGRDERNLSLLEAYQSDMEAAGVHSYDGDGMVPHGYRRYWYTFEAGEALLAETDDYAPDHREYLSYVWTNAAGAVTHRGVGVGSTEAELLAAYTEQLYYLEADAAEPAMEKYTEDLQADCAFDCAYAWQPYTTETNDIRDITFYMRDGRVASVEMTQPFELRYVYGYDRDAGLRYTDEKRAN